MLAKSKKYIQNQAQKVSKDDEYDQKTREKYCWGNSNFPVLCLIATTWEVRNVVVGFFSAVSVNGRGKLENMTE